MNEIKGTLKPMRGKVFVEQLERGERVAPGGIVLLDDDMTNNGIRARWGKVYAMGEGVDDIKVGDWVLIKHGRWTNGIDLETPDGKVTRIWHIEYPKSVELISDEFPLDIKPIN